MMEFLKQIDWVSLSAALVAVIGAAASFVVVISNARHNKRVKDIIDDATRRETWIECPHCKKKIPLSQVNFHLPSGEIDNNLNGLPDHSEHR